MAAFRLPVGGRIDRSRPLSIQFNGRELHGYPGDTVASLLLANGIHHVARSFKYHRPRGIVSHGSDEPSALLKSIVVPVESIRTTGLPSSKHTTALMCHRRTIGRP